jgi:hypothetical protein
MNYRSVVCKDEIHHKAGRQDCRSASGDATELDNRRNRTGTEASEHPWRWQCAFMEQTGRSEDKEGDKKEVAPIKQVKKRSIDPDLKEFIDNAIVPILVKEYQIVNQIEAAVRERLKAAQTFKKGKM